MPTTPIPTHQEIAFGLALAQYLNINPERFILTGWETTGDYQTAQVDLRTFIPTNDLLHMFNTGRLPDPTPEPEWPGGEQHAPLTQRHRANIERTD